MRIVIDLQGAQGENQHRGIGRYALSLTKAIAQNCGSHEVWVALNSLFPDAIDTLRKDLIKIIPAQNIVVWHTLAKVEYYIPENEKHRHQAECMREFFLASLKPDIVLISSLFEGYTTNVVTSVHKYAPYTRTAVILYDLIPFKHPKQYLLSEQQAAHYYEKIGFLQKADLLLSISEGSTQECMEELKITPSKIATISSAVDKRFKKIALSTVHKENLKNCYHIHKEIILYPGGCDPRKNMEKLIKAYADMPHQIRDNYQLVITCSMNEKQKNVLFAVARNVGLPKNQLILTGFVPDETLIELYNLAYLVVFPSMAEGFGLPVLEAMSCGTVTIGSNIPSIAEIIADERALFDPKDTSSITNKLTQVLTDPIFYTELKQHCIKRAMLFSWDNCAKKAIRAFEQLIENEAPVKKSVKLTPRASLAYISPLPPEPNGISDYSAELLPLLSKYYDIDVIVVQSAVTDPWINENCIIRDVAWFKKHAKEYDRILYHFGNSIFHHHMFGLLSDIPGVIVLHDFFLSGIIAQMEFSDIERSFWTKALYHSHGYHALLQKKKHEDPSALIYEYPCNLQVLQQALGIITHSQHSIDLAKRYYNNINPEKWSIVPLLRMPPEGIDRDASKKILGLPKDAFIICSFGMIQPTKLNERIVEAVFASKLSEKNNIFLILVGECPDIKYRDKLNKIAKKIKSNISFTITDRVDHKTFSHYLMATDIAVQLRTLSRGETSAAILDCMNYGVATIANAHGAIAELPKNSIVMLQDNFQNTELISALEYLWQNPRERMALGARAQEFIHTQHNPADCARSYRESIERFYSDMPIHLSHITTSLMSQRKNQQNNQTDLIELSNALARNHPPRPRLKQLFFDVSTIIQSDDKTGIQRVVRAELQQLILSPPENFRVEPVYLNHEQDGWNYYYATQYTSNLLNIETFANDAPIDIFPGDVFLMSDLHFQISEATAAGVYKRIRHAGASINVLVYDLIPITHPHFFPPNAFELFNRWLCSITDFADNLICISEATRAELKKWIHEQHTIVEESIEISVVTLGADILASIPTFNLPPTAAQFLKNLNPRNSFLMVGTVEPRKGHAQVLHALEYLWNEHIEANLVIVGKQGWLTDGLVDKIKQHPQFNKRLFWPENISDAFLGKIYDSCNALIMASEVEGFGLPIIEAAKHHLPIIARDIPVFREIAGSAAYYFNGLEPTDLAKAIKHWLTLYTTGKAPSSKNISWLTWHQHAEELKKKLAYTQKRA